MTWHRAPVAVAIAGVLEGLDPFVTVFDAPPATLNPPAFYVGYPTTVAYDAFTFGVDTITLPISAVAGLSEGDRVDGLLDAARKAFEDTDTLAGVVAACRVSTQQSWRVLSVGGADLLAADLVLDLKM